MRLEQILDILIYRDSMHKLFKKCMIDNFKNQIISDDYISSKLDELQKYIIEGKAYCIGAFIDDNFIGFVWFFKVLNFNEERIHLNQIIVDEKYQNQGIGKKLLKEVYKYAKDCNISIVELFATKENDKVTKFYDNSGFEPERIKYLKHID